MSPRVGRGVGSLQSIDAQPSKGGAHEGDPGRGRSAGIATCGGRGGACSTASRRADARIRDVVDDAGSARTVVPSLVWGREVAITKHHNVISVTIVPMKRAVRAIMAPTRSCSC